MEETPEQEEKYTRPKRVVRIILIVSALAVCVLAIVVFLGPGLQSAWQWYWGPPEARGDLSVTERKDLAQGAGPYAQALAVLFTGVVALTGLYFTRLNTDKQLAEARESTEKHLRQARESQERTQASAQENLRLTEQGQITERFTRAIEQFGNDKFEIRLGGIYALERIAEDSERDHWPIVEVLTAYVREHSPWPPKRSGTLGEGNTFIPPSASHQRTAPHVRLDPDVQVVLSVLGRRSRYYGNGEMKSLDLYRTDLRKAELRRAHLEGANLIEAHLEGAGLIKAHLEGANLTQAHLEGAFLAQAHLEEALLIEAHLEGGTILVGAHLEGASLVKAHLEGASLIGAHLKGANLIEAHLEGTDLSRATELTQKQIESAYGDRKTVLPKGLKYPAHWDQSSNDQPNRDE